MNRVMDLRQFQEAAQRRNILNLLAVLQEGDSFTLLNSSDPKALLETLDTDTPQSLTLEYLERGPETWRLRLTKRGEAEKESCCGFCGGT